MSSVSKPRVRHNRHKQGLNLTLEKLSADFRYQNIWNLLKDFISLHRQRFAFDYAAECGEQGFIDTAPFKSHLRVAFIFHIFFETIYYTWVIEYAMRIIPYKAVQPPSNPSQLLPLHREDTILFVYRQSYGYQSINFLSGYKGNKNPPHFSTFLHEIWGLE